MVWCKTHQIIRIFINNRKEDNFMQQKRFTIGLPEDVYKLLKEQAERDHRTLGQQIAYLLEVYVPSYQKTMETTFPNTFTKPIYTPENPDNRPIFTNNIITNNTKRKEII